MLSEKYMVGVIYGSAVFGRCWVNGAGLKILSGR